MKNFLSLRNATKLSILLSVLLCCAFLKAQAPCGNPQGAVCCGGGYPQGCSWNSQGPDYCVTAYVNCGPCGSGYYVIDASPGSCNRNGLRPRVIKGLLALAKGREVLMPACGGGFRPLVERPVAIAQQDWDLPKELPILR